MNVNLSNAISHFFPNPSYEQIYFEAVANALDAGATEINIEISIEDYNRSDTLRLKVSDNGEGFTEENFQRFSNLMDAANKEHKGLGRLLYLVYFHKINIESVYKENTSRSFCYTKDFSGSSNTGQISRTDCGTILSFENFAGERIKSYDYLVPGKIRESLMEHFFLLLFQKKINKEELVINISLDTVTPNPDYDFYSTTLSLKPVDIPELNEKRVGVPEVDLVENIDIYYTIENDLTKPKSLLTALCIDGRSQRYPVIDSDRIPDGYQCVFLFTSGLLQGKTDPSRQQVIIDSAKEKALKKSLRREVGCILQDKIPKILEHNSRLREDLVTKFPHLEGYFPSESAGLLIRNESIEMAQKSFFRDQREILECSQLDEDLYDKALAVSARVLMEYILYRTYIIQKLKETGDKNSEGEIHDLIVPRRRTLRTTALESDIYNNNVWMLDDKYMSYTTILSDEEMTKVIKEIAENGNEDDGRPDLTLVFSKDPSNSPKVDVVVVELKKHGVKLAQKEEVISQLRQRARRLLTYYPNKINRIWFYGITDIDAEFRLSLKEGEFKELFSLGTMFYKPQPIYLEDGGEPFYVDLYVLTYETLIHDAEIRNETFLRILKEKIHAITSESSLIEFNIPDENES